MIDQDQRTVTIAGLSTFKSTGARARQALISCLHSPILRSAVVDEGRRQSNRTPFPLGLADLVSAVSLASLAAQGMAMRAIGLR
jgi:hypothetical protein